MTGSALGAALRPSSLRVRPTLAGRGLLFLTGASFLLAWLDAGAEFEALAAFSGALALAAAIACWARGSALRVLAPQPVTAFAGERFALEVSVRNLALRAAAYDVLLSTDHAHPTGPRVGAFLPRVAAGREERAEVWQPLMRRGLHDQGTLEVATTYPLGLWTCRLRFELPNGVLVLPRLGTMRRADLGGPRVRGASEDAGRGRGDEQEVYGIRAWRAGEPLRAVHWKLSARRGRILVREFRNEPRPPVHVILATGLAEDSRAARGAFEEAVSLAATLVEHQLRRGHAARLTILGASTKTVACRRGRTALFPVLRALAEVVPDTTGAGRDAGAATRQGVRGERTYLVRVASDPAAEPARRLETDEGVTILEVTTRGLPSVYDRRRRPGADLLYAVAS